MPSYFLFSFRWPKRQIVDWSAIFVGIGMLFNPPWIAGHPAFRNKNTFGTYIHGTCACQSSNHSNQVWKYFCSTPSYHMDIFPLPGCSAPHAREQIPDFPSVAKMSDWFSIFVAIGKLFRFPCPPWIASHPAFRNKNTFGTYIRGALHVKVLTRFENTSVQHHTCGNHCNQYVFKSFGCLGQNFKN